MLRICSSKKSIIAYIPLTLKVFGTQIQLNLRRNDQIVSPLFNVWKHDAKGITKKLSQSNASSPCYYFHEDNITISAIKFRQKSGWEGFVLLKDDTLEIRPLRDDLASSSLTDNFCVKEEINISFGKTHLIKRSLQLSADTSFYNLNNFKLKRRYVKNTQKKLTIELAVFFDEAAYRTFMPFLDENKKMLRMLILAYVNNIQAVFHHPSLGVSIDISLVYLEIMEKQPSHLPVFGGNASEVLDLFCYYAQTRNPPDDNDPHHWDVGLYVTGINIGEMEEGILGLAHPDGGCNLTKSCAIVEFGTASKISTGFSSSLIAAHEIGHVLGIEHDSMPCDIDKYIMSHRKLYQGQVTWSECSRNTVEELWTAQKCLGDRTRSKDVYDHSRYHDLPGRQWTAKAQCEIYFRDNDANVVSLLDICKTLQCELFNKNGSYFTGPALEGTYCAPGKECRGGECVSVIKPYNFKCCPEDNWSEWKEGTCQSSCFKKSKGVRVRRRSCKHRNRRSVSCKGLYYDVVLCNDTLFCTEKRKMINSFIKMKCMAMFSDLTLKLTTDLDLEWQASHDVEKPWIACTIHCPRRKLSTDDVHLEMLSFRIDPYLPDGTWCHNENGQDYYCRQHYCLPESYSYE
ncbi:A disintegrin and metalloproteinase with thrombospondin motifs adt-2-like isoform X2 [Linepithema humile]|uniref:A disintegrin and metalloproteinase with thrombospondin motifs adt-2-like isoform X2 n=1 Tax=Linepithema humile TaxID=83485 RepID=UPI00351DD0B1